MKTDYGDTISELIQFEAVGGSSSKAVVRTQWFNDSSNTWVDFEDIEGRTITFSNRNNRYQSYSFLPPSDVITFQLNNFNQVYSTGSGNEKASILKKNLLVRAWSGFELNTGARATNTDDFTGGKYVHAQKSGSSVILDNSSYTGTVNSGANLVLYDSANYGATTYSPAGYYHKRVSIDNAETTFITFNIDVGGDDFDVRFRTAPTSTAMETAGWGNFTTLSSGANVVNINKGIDDDYLEYLVRFKTPQWSDTDSINSISYETIDKIFLFKRGTFVLDEPDYDDTKVKCRGRDYLKKALETKINLPDYSTATNVQSVMTDIFDRCSVPYDTALWDVTSTTVTVNGTLGEKLNDVSGWQAADYIMDAINAGNDDWRIKVEEDGGLSLKILETDREADWNAHYIYNIEKVNKDFDSDKQLQRVTAVNKDIVVNKESLLVSYTGTGTDLHLTYGTSAIYVRYEDDNTVIVSEDARTNTAIDFTCSGSTADIKVYGCTPRNAITDEIWSERGDSSNIVKNEGSTYKKTNPFFSQTMANEWVEYMIERNADPRKKITLSMVTNPYLELNDKITVFDLYTYTDDIYHLQEIKESWREPVLKDTLILEDAGIDLENLIWDRNGYSTGINDLDYDTGLSWDQDLEIGGSDNTDYSYLKSINFS